MSAAVSIHSAVVGTNRYELDDFPVSYGLPAQKSVYQNLVNLDDVRKDTTAALFAFHAEKWERETINMSSMTDMFNHPSYRAIVDLGHIAVPMLLERLKSDPDYWFAALSSITGTDPVQPKDAGNLDRMAAAWLEWGQSAHS